MLKTEASGISVIIPVYNSSKYLSCCIDSVISQTFSNLQIIIIDDHSTDGSREIINTYKTNDKIQVFFNNKNLGAAYCRNFGIQHAKHDLIGFIDSDDFIPETYFASLFKKINESMADIAVCDFRIFSDDYEAFIKGLQGDESNYSFINHSMSASPCNKLFRKASIQEFLFEEEIANEDIATVIPALVHAQKICYVPKCYYHYRQHNESVQNSQFSSKRFEIFKAVSAALHRIKDTEQYEKYSYAIIFNQLILLLLGAIPKEKSFKKRYTFIKEYCQLIKKYDIDEDYIKKEFLALHTFIKKRYYFLMIKLTKKKKIFFADFLMQLYRFWSSLNKRNLQSAKKPDGEIVTGRTAFYPKVSIIIPVYNGSNFMQQAIDSALSQEYQNIEVIVINDGSDDNGQTDNIARIYRDRIRYFTKKNGGVATALNLGIEKMEGEYFSWLSHDDIYDSNKISNEINIVRHLEDRTTVIAGGYTVVSEFGERMCDVNLLNHYTQEELSRPLFCVFRGGINGCATLIHKSHFTRVGVFDSTLPTTQDYDLWFRILRGQKLCYYNACNVKSREHANQGSKQIVGAHTKEQNRLWIRMMESLTDKERTIIDGSPFLFYLNTTEFLENALGRDEAFYYAKQRAISTAPGYLFTWWMMTLYRQIRKIFRCYKFHGIRASVKKIEIRMKKRYSKNEKI